MNIKKILVFIMISLNTVFLFGCGNKAAVTQTQEDLTGTIEVKEVNVSSKLAGRIDKLLVDENQNVKAGQVIAILSNQELKAKEEQAEALVNAAKVMLEQAQDNVSLQEKLAKSNIDKADAGLDTAKYQYDKAKNGARNEEIAQAQTSYDLMKKTYDRVKYLAEKGAVPQQKADEVKAQLDVAKEKLEIAKNAVRPEDIKTAEAMVEQVKASVDAANTAPIQIELARENVSAAQAKYEQALGGLQEVQAYLKDTKIVSPIDGTITLLNSKQGELVSSGYTIAVVSNLNDMWADFKVRETEISKFSINQKVKIYTTAFNNELFDGHISNIDKKPDFAAKRSTNERDEKDIIAFNVKVKINNNGKLRPGLTAYLKCNDN